MAIDLAGISSQVVNIAVLVMSVVIGGSMVGGLLYFWLILKRFRQYTCIIFEKDGFGQTVRKTDRAGIYIDKKTNNKRLFLQKNKVGLNPDKIPYITDEKGKKVIYLYKTGLKNFRYINFDIDDQNFDITVGEEDVNWALNAYERSKKVFSQSMLMQLMPYMAIAFVSIIILVIFIYFFKDFAVLKDMAQAMKEAAQELAMARSGTTVIPGQG